jgi:hypothetical protein
MASEVKADKLSPSGGTALQIGDASDTITIPTGATFTITDGLGVAGGGTGLTSFTAGDVFYATGTTTLAKLAKGSAEEVLSMNSGATAPEWTTAAATAGGTGQTGFTAGDLLYANSTTTLTKLGKGTARQGLQTNSGATAPEWVNSPQSLMTAAGDIIYASGANTLAKLAKGSDDDVLTLASGVPSWAAAAGGGKIGQVLQVVDSTTRTTTSGSLNDMSSTLIGVITPVATTSKILVMVTSTLQSPTYGWGGWLYRDIAGGGYEEVGGNYALEVAGVAKQATGTVMCYLDSPSTTSECSYQPYFSITGSGTLTLQYGGNQTYGTITTMEILA